MWLVHTLADPGSSVGSKKSCAVTLRNSSAQCSVEVLRIVDDLETELPAIASPPSLLRFCLGVETEQRVQPRHVLSRATTAKLRTREAHDLDILDAEFLGEALDARSRRSL